MEEQKNSFIAWIKAHRKELIIAGISVATIIAIILGIKNREAIMELWDSLKRSVSKTHGVVKNVAASAPVSIPNIELMPVKEINVVVMEETTRISFDVSEHIRNLHEGWKPSAEKIAEAEAMRIALQPGQTLVDAYTKGTVAA